MKTKKQLMADIELLDRAVASIPANRESHVRASQAVGNIRAAIIAMPDQPLPEPIPEIPHNRT